MTDTNEITPTPTSEQPVEPTTSPDETVTAEATAVEVAATEEVAASPVEAAPEAVVETVSEAVVEASAPLATPSSMGELTVGMELSGKVKRIELFGAFIDIGVGKDGLLHISQLGRADVRNVEDVVQVGQVLNVFVLKVDPELGRIALSLNKPVGMPWEALKIGMEVKGTVVKIETYGAFIEFGAERPGMVHVSELASGYVKSPADVVEMGSTITAQIIKLDRRKKRIDLSVKALTEKETAAAQTYVREEAPENLPTAMEVALRRAMSDDDFASSSSKPSGKKDKDRYDRRDRRRDRDRDYEDIFERTLRGHRN